MARMHPYCVGLIVSALACAPSGDAAPPLRIIDAHIHTAFTGEPEPASGIPQTRDELVRAMREAGVVGAVAHGDSVGGGYADLTDLGVIHCAGIGTVVDTARIAEGLRAGRYRCLKIYLGYAARYPTDAAYEPAYRLALAYDVPVVFHTGDTYSANARVRYAHPLPIDDVAVEHRDVTFVIAHAGYPWVESAAEVAYKNPNVYIEASAFMVGNPAAKPAAWLDRYVVDPISWLFGYVEDPSKLLFASDWPLVAMAGYVEAYKRAIPREHWGAVFHDNAARVFKLDAATRPD